MLTTSSRQGALLLLLLVALPIVFLACQQGSLRVDRDNRSMKSVDSRAASLMERRIREFGEDHIVLLGFELEPGGDATDHGEDLAALTRELHSLGNVGRVFPVAGLPEDLRVLAVEVEGDGRSGGYATAVERVVELAKSHELPGVRLHVTGQPVAEVAIAQAVEAEQRRVVPILVAGLLALLLAVYRHLGIALAALAPAGLGIAAVGGIYALAGQELDPISSLLRPVILSVGVAGAVHLVEGYRSRRFSGMTPERAASATTRDLLIPALLTAGTTAAGFLALTTNAIPAVSRFGLFAALGAALTCGLSLVVTPGLLVLLARGKSAFPPRSPAAPGPSRSEYIASWLREHRRWILATSAALVATSSILCLGLRADTDPIRLLPENHEFRRATDYVSTRMGGVETFDVLIPRDSELAAPPALVKLTRSLLLRPSVVRLAGPIRKSADGTHMITAVITPGGTNEREALFADIEAEWGGEDGDEILVTGTSVQIAQDSGELVRGQLLSIGITLIVLFVVISASFRSWRFGLLGLLSNLLPGLLLYGGIAALGRPLSVASAMIGTVMLGLVVDDTIHFLYRHQRARLRGAPVSVAVISALRHAGRPIVITSLVLSCGFALGVFGTLETTREFSLLAAATISLALLADLFLLPALLLGRGEEGSVVSPSLFHEESEVSVA